MAKKTQKQSSTRAITFLLVGVMSIPLVTQFFLKNPGVHTAELVTLFESDINSIREKALEDRGRFRMQRRAYSRARNRCQDRLRDGEDVTCPDFNDTATYDVAPTVEEIEAEAEQEVVEEKKVTSVRDLSAQERKMLRTYTRAGFCSKAAGMILYNLCMDIVGDTAEDITPVGIQNDNIKLHGANRTPRASLRLRLRMMDEAISGSRGRRDDLKKPLRFQGGLNN